MKQISSFIVTKKIVNTFRALCYSLEFDGIMRRADWLVSGCYQQFVRIWTNRLFRIIVAMMTPSWLICSSVGWNTVCSLEMSRIFGGFMWVHHRFIILLDRFGIRRVWSSVFADLGMFLGSIQVWTLGFLEKFIFKRLKFVFGGMNLGWSEFKIQTN